jgi:hypothetical protein
VLTSAAKVKEPSPLTRQISPKIVRGATEVREVLR